MHGPTHSPRTGVALAAGGMAVLSTEAVTIRLAGVPTWDAVFWIGWFTAAVATGWIRVVDRAPLIETARRGGSPLLVAGMLQGATTACFVIAVSTTSVANVVVLLSATPLAAASIAWWWLGERIGPRVAVGIGSAIVGSVVVVAGTAGSGGGQVGGDLMALAAVVCFGATTALLRRHPSLSRPAIIGIGGVVMVVVGAWNVAPGSMDARAWLLLAVVGAVTGPVARVMLALAPRHLPAAQVGLFVPVETVLAILWARLVFGEAPTASTIAGAVVIVGGLVLAVLGELRSAPVSAGDGGRRPRGRAGTSRQGVSTQHRSPWRRHR